MYFLDTDVSSYLMKRSHPALVKRVKAFAPRELKISTITAFELEFGAWRSGRREKVRRVLDAFFLNVEVVPFDFEAARQAGAIRAELTTGGNLIGGYDLLIAGHARSRDATLVTNNVREFARVSGLSVENWSEAT